MPNPSSIQADPSVIGRVPSPPFARLPRPAELFDQRAQRLRALSAASDLGPYLSFVAGLAEIQHRLQALLPEPNLPDPETLSRAGEFGMPPLDRNTIGGEKILTATLDRMFDLAGEIDMPIQAKAALSHVKESGSEATEAMVRDVLSNAIPAEMIAEHVFVAAGLQVHFSRLAAKLDVGRLVRVGDGACPCCGGPPVSSLVVGWMEAEGARYCACALCGTLWNVVRVKCVLCSSTKGIGYQEIEGGSGTIKAECCDVCHGYVKVLYQQKDVSLDPVADDIASLGLDLLLREGEYHRGGFNPFLMGF